MMNKEECLMFNKLDVNEIKLRERFIKDMNLPIGVYESPYFEYYLDLYEPLFGSLTKWNELRKVVDDSFNGNSALFLEEYHNVKECMLNDIKKSDAYNEFNTMDMNAFSIAKSPFANTPSSNIYKETNDGKLFVSFDLSKANFQVMKYANIIDSNLSWDDYVEKYTKLDYIKNSKYTRQVVFGNLNPKRQITLEKFIINEILKVVDMELKQEDCGTNFKLVSLSNDEFVYEFDGTKYDLERVLYKRYSTGKRIFNVSRIPIEVSVKPFKLELLQYKTYNDKKVTCYLKKYLDHTIEIKECSKYYFSQVYKDLMGIQVVRDDLVFLMEGQISFFEYPLQRVKKEEEDETSLFSNTIVLLGTDEKEKFNYCIGTKDEETYLMVFERLENNDNGRLITYKPLKNIVEVGKWRLNVADGW